MIGWIPEPEERAYLCDPSHAAREGVPACVVEDFVISVRQVRPRVWISSVAGEEGGVTLKGFKTCEKAMRDAIQLAREM